MALIKADKQVSVTSDHVSISDKLSPGVYTVKLNPMTGFYLEQGEDFKLPKKLYGDFSDIKYWTKSFEANERNVGILLCGLKGTGKTIEAKKFCIDSGKPVILVTESFMDNISHLISFLTTPEFRDSIIFIDEFEKIYPEQSQQALLSLLDGVYNTKFAFILTVNHPNISEFLINRLGRIRYRKNYDSLDPKIVDEILVDYLINQDHKMSVHSFFFSIGICTYDLLMNLIGEMNLFNEDAIRCGSRLNVEPVEGLYTLTEVIDGEQVCESSVNLSISDFINELKEPGATLQSLDFYRSTFQIPEDYSFDSSLLETKYSVGEYQKARLSNRKSDHKNVPAVEPTTRTGELSGVLSEALSASVQKIKASRGISNNSWAEMPSKEFMDTMIIPEMDNKYNWFIHPQWGKLPAPLCQRNPSFGAVQPESMSFSSSREFEIKVALPNVDYRLRFKFQPTKYTTIFV